jgi:hypothetical protein
MPVDHPYAQLLRHEFHDELNHQTEYEERSNFYPNKHLSLTGEYLSLPAYATAYPAPDAKYKRNEFPEEWLNWYDGSSNTRPNGKDPWFDDT